MCWIQLCPLKNSAFIKSHNCHNNVMLWRWFRGTPCPMGVISHWKINKLAQADPLRWSRMWGAYTQAQPENPKCEVTVATFSFGSAGTQGRVELNAGSPPPLSFPCLQQKPGQEDNLDLPLLQQTWRRVNKIHKSQERLDSESSAACSAM